MEKQVKKIGVLTSGGDAPGMNAAIRAVVRTALNNNIEVVGIKKGYNGLMNGDIKNLTGKDVSDILNRGGTILYSARALDMLKEEGREKAANIYKVLGLDALVVIGGDGSFRGCQALAKYGVNCIGIPATIDLDISCSEYTIGFDTAVNTGVDAITKLRDTSSSHERCSVCEVMGRDAGYIALWCAMAGGAEEVLIPEKKEIATNDRVIKQIVENRSKGKHHNLVVVAEGIGKSQELAKEIQDKTGIETRATILGHLQRGGTPTAIDRIHASRMGYIAVKSIIEGNVNKVVAYNKGEYQTIDIEEALNMEKQFDGEMYDIVKILSI